MKAYTNSMKRICLRDEQRKFSWDAANYWVTVDLVRVNDAKKNWHFEVTVTVEKVATIVENAERSGESCWVVFMSVFECFKLVCGDIEEKCKKAKSSEYSKGVQEKMEEFHAAGCTPPEILKVAKKQVKSLKIQLADASAAPLIRTGNKTHTKTCFCAWVTVNQQSLCAKKIFARLSQSIRAAKAKKAQLTLLDGWDGHEALNCQSTDSDK